MNEKPRTRLAFISGEDAHDQSVASLLEELANLRAETDPAGGESNAVGKDVKAWRALRKAHRLVRVVAGWAIDHQFGLALKGLEFEPGGNLKDRPEYRARLDLVDSHEHEQNGAAASRDLTIDPAVGRKLLYNLLVANPGAMPSSLWNSAVEAVKALEYGETLPLLRAGRNRKRRYKQLQLQLKAIGFVEYRAELGGNKGNARDVVSAAFGQSSHTLRTWVDRLRDEFGVVHVLRVMETARNSAICVRRAQRCGLKGEDNSDSSDHVTATLHETYGDEALKVAGRKYLQ